MLVLGGNGDGDGDGDGDGAAWEEHPGDADVGREIRAAVVALQATALVFLSGRGCVPVRVRMRVRVRVPVRVPARCACVCATCACVVRACVCA